MHWLIFVTLSEIKLCLIICQPARRLHVCLARCKQLGRLKAALGYCCFTWWNRQVVEIAYSSKRKSEPAGNEPDRMNLAHAQVAGDKD